MIEVEENQPPSKENPPCNLTPHGKKYFFIFVVFLGESGLLRLFYSDLFDASMALQYLFKSRDSGILQFLGNRLFDLSKVDLDFYLPQLLILYLYTEEPTRNCIHPYLVGR